jgi:uncharacterized Zn finger protein
MSRWNRYDDFEFPQYVTVAERKKQAQQKIKKLSAKGEKLSPVVIEGRAIAKTFWGKAWCKNIESYQDYENRLPRGRSYARSGAVIDLQIEKGKIKAQVMGSELYEINIAIKELPTEKWERIKKECAGKIGSLIDLIQGKLSPEIIELICRKDDGLFPTPKEIKLDCNCPDWADLCKHLAAVLYGIGARLDKEPELFFILRGVDQNELLGSDFADNLVSEDESPDIAADDLGGIFGIELDELDVAPQKNKEPQKRKAAAKKAKAKSSAKGKRKQNATKKATTAKKTATKPAKKKATTKRAATKKTAAKAVKKKSAASKKTASKKAAAKTKKTTAKAKTSTKKKTNTKKT